MHSFRLYGVLIWSFALSMGVASAQSTLSYEHIGTSDNGEVFRVYATPPAGSLEISAVFGDSQHPIHLIADSGFFNASDGIDLADEPFENSEMVELDSWFTIGAIPGEFDGTIQSIGLEQSFLTFNNGGEFQANSEAGGMWFCYPGSTTSNDPDEDGRVLIAQLVSESLISLTLNYQYKNEEGDAANVLGDYLSIGVIGCQDSDACNFDPEAITDDGLCIYDDEDGDGICDGEDNCVGQVDECGICNGPGEVYECGCFDLPSEPNWCSCGDIPEGDCDCDGNQLDALGICGGWCEADANGNGVCDCVEADPEGACGCDIYEDDLGECGGNVFYGCTYAFAVNFDVDATVDDGSCALSGCTHPMAINYNPLAEIEDASCLFGGCTDSVASNYGVNAGSLGYVFTEIEHDVPYPMDYGLVFNQVSDDWLSEPVYMDWEFELFGVAYTQFQVSSNGYLFFDDSAVSSGYSLWSINGQLPSDALPFPAIFAVYNDMDPSTCGTIHYGIDGESPQRKWVVSWNELCVFGSGGTCQDQFVSAQLILHETSNAIEFHVINRSSCSGWNDDALIIGLQNENATLAHTAPDFNNESPIVSERSWLALPLSDLEANFDDGSCLYAGCMDPLACNFQPDAIESDDTCIYVQNTCGDGTVWDEASQTCVLDPSCQTDVNQDGIVSVADLLMLLADFGSECSIELDE